MIPTLRPYQMEAITKIRNACLTGSRAVLAVLPTGAGKTNLGCELARSAVAKGRKVLWIAHRTELIEQAYDRLREFGLNPGAIAAGTVRPPQPFAPVQVASIQTLLARHTRPQANLVIYDECHHAPSDLWSQLVEDYRASAHLIGFTATPERSDGRGLGNLFTRIVVGARVRELVDLSFLVPCEIRRPASKMRPGAIAQRPVDAYLTEANGRRAVVFSPNVAAAKAHLEEFTAAGIRAALVHAGTPPGDRATTLRGLHSGAVQVLLNVYVCTEGWDCPPISCVILARGCGTAGIFLQMVGRGLRLAPGKLDCLLLDLHGISHIHGHPEDDRVYSLEGKGIRRGDDATVEGDQPSCRVCGAPVQPGEACPECGTEPRVMVPPTVTGAPLVRYAAKRAEGPEKQAETLARWMRTGAEKGYKDGWASQKFKSVYGAWPTPTVQSQARRAV